MIDYFKENPVALALLILGLDIIARKYIIPIMPDGKVMLLLLKPILNIVFGTLLPIYGIYWLIFKMEIQEGIEGIIEMKLYVLGMCILFYALLYNAIKYNINELKKVNNLK